MQTAPASVTRLIEELAELPGIGRKTAARLTFFLLRNQSGLAGRLAEAPSVLMRAVIIAPSVWSKSHSTCWRSSSLGCTRALITSYTACWLLRRECSLRICVSVS